MGMHVHNNTITLRPKRMFKLHIRTTSTLNSILPPSSHIIYRDRYILRTYLLPAAWRLVLTVLAPAPDQELMLQEKGTTMLVTLLPM